MVKIAVDVMGMDKGSKVAVEAITQFLNMYDDVEVVAFGKEEELKEESKEILTFLKESLGESTKEVIVSKRLKSHPVCISNAGEISIEMEKVLKASPEGNNFKAERIAHRKKLWYTHW